MAKAIQNSSVDQAPEDEEARLARIQEWDSKLFVELNEPFPQEMERTLVKGGTRLTYLPVSEVITRLNRVFGPTGWSSEIIKCERDSLDPDFIVAHVRLRIDTPAPGFLWGVGTVKDGFGGQKVKRTKAGEIVDLGDEFKGAVSDALKKAAQQLGIGLYLARDPEAIEIDDARHAPEPQPNITAAMYENFMSLRNQLNEAQLNDLRSYWKSYSGGRPVPKPAEFTEQELEVLIVECTRLIVSGQYTVPTNDEPDDE